MIKNCCLLVFVVTSLLVGCDSAKSVVDNQPGPVTTPPPPPPYIGPQGHYLGRLWGDNAGPFTIYDYKYGCDGPFLSLGDNPPVSDESACLTDLTRDGGPATEADLKSGDIIEVYTHIDLSAGAPPVEIWIDIRRTVVGLIEAIDSTHARMTVMGQQVFVTNQTMGSGEPFPAWGDVVDLGDFAVGDRVAVSGHFSANGEVMATLIEPAPESDAVVLRGILTTGSNGLFKVGQLEVDLGGAALEDFAGGTPLVGDAVLLFADADPQAGVLSVRTARYAGKDWIQYGQSLLSGFVTAARATNDFDVGGINYHDLEGNCIECSQLAVPLESGPPLFVRAPSPITLGYYLTHWVNTSLVGPIDSIDYATASFSILGITVQTSPGTIITPASTGWGFGATLNIEDLVAGETVASDVGAVGNTLLAGRVMQTDTESGPRIRATLGRQGSPVVTASDSSIQLLGRTIEIDASTVMEYCDKNDNCMSVGPEWLLTHSLDEPLFLIIDLDSAVDNLRAKYIVLYEPYWV